MVGPAWLGNGWCPSSGGAGGHLCYTVPFLPSILKSLHPHSKPGHVTRSSSGCLQGLVIPLRGRGNVPVPRESCLPPLAGATTALPYCIPRMGAEGRGTTASTKSPSQLAFPPTHVSPGLGVLERGGCPSKALPEGQGQGRGGTARIPFPTSIPKDRDFLKGGRCPGVQLSLLGRGVKAAFQHLQIVALPCPTSGLLCAGTSSRSCPTNPKNHT